MTERTEYGEQDVVRVANKFARFYRSVSQREQAVIRAFLEAASARSEVVGYMKAGFTSLPYDPSRVFVAVLMQQGRVQLDADWGQPG